MIRNVLIQFAIIPFIGCLCSGQTMEIENIQEIDSLASEVFNNSLYQFGFDTVYHNSSNYTVGDGKYIRIRDSKGEVNYSIAYDAYCDSVFNQYENSLEKFMMENPRFQHIFLVDSKNKFILVSCQKLKTALGNTSYSFIPVGFSWVFRESNYDEQLFNTFQEFKNISTESSIYSNERYILRTIRNDDTILIAY